jgi:RhtB (resistance to homoserine/threonine) family protein
MPAVPALVPFLMVAGLIIITPGPDMAVITKSALSGGRRAALETVLGIQAGLLIWATASVLGLAAILSASAELYTVIRLAGAVYLVWLGLTSLRAAWIGRPEPTAPNVPQGRWRSPFAQGFLSNILNPKIAVLFTSLIPQFVTPGPDAGVQSAILALTFLAAGFAWITGFAIAASSFSDLLRRSRVRRAIDALTGAVLVALGLRLALEAR